MTTFYFTDPCTLGPTVNYDIYHELSKKYRVRLKNFETVSPTDKQLMIYILAGGETMSEYEYNYFDRKENIICKIIQPRNSRLIWKDWQRIISLLIEEHYKYNSSKNFYERLY